MIHLKHVLMPTDFSDPSQNALRYAKALAETFDAQLHVLHVVEESTIAYTFASPEGSLIVPDMREQMLSAAQRHLDTVLTAAERGQYRARLELVTGSPFMEILRYAKRESIDLIVMGTHGRGPIAHMLMGSVAEKVVRKAPCPVLTVRHPEHEFVMP